MEVLIMRHLQLIFLITLLSVLPALVDAAPAVPASATISFSPVVGVITQPSRDDSHEDSVYYEYGFEDGLNEWTTSDLTDAGNMWHTNERHAFEDGSSWWCANPEIGEGGGYNNHWLQYLITPAIDLSEVENAQLDFVTFWAMEAAGDGMPQDYDGWDGFNVWIKVSGDDDWEVIEPTDPDYYYESLYSFGEEWNMGPGIAGWGGESDGWVEASFDLSAFVGNADVRIRWAFCSDPADATPDNDSYLGAMVDNMSVTGDDEVIWSNSGDEQGDMELGTGPTSGDHWEISDASSHSGDFSAHCPVQANLQDALISPVFDIPDDPWYTYFDFWIHVDTPNWDPDGDGTLDDYFSVDYSTDGVEWEQIIYDYARDQNWLDDFHFFGPDSTFNVGLPDWKVKLNLTRFAGESVQLRWTAKTDDVMGDNEGTGFWIDDFRLNITNRAEFDVRADWLSISYPTALSLDIDNEFSITNLGISDLDMVRQYYQIGNYRKSPIIPWRGLDSDETKELTFELATEYAEITSIAGFVDVRDDQIAENDTARVDGVVIYPEGIWVMGYDTRVYPFAFRFDQGSGPAILYTPEDDGLDDQFDFVALRVLWNGAQQGDNTTNLHIYTDNDGMPGQELYSAEINVTRADLLPNEHVIDLSAVESLKELSNNFWVWFEILNGDNEPSVVGNDELLSEGHYFGYDGEDLSDRNFDFQIHPVLMPAGADWTMLVPGRDDVEFEDVEAGTSETINLTIFNGGITPITIESFEFDQVGFDVVSDSALPRTLDIGDFTNFTIIFSPEGDELFESYMSIVSAEVEPLVVRVSNHPLGINTPGNGNAIPTAYALGKAFPNPFNSQAVITYSLPRSEMVTLEVFDLNGRKVAELFSGNKPAGNHQAIFNGANLSTGVFVYRLQAGNFEATAKVVLVR